MNAQSIPDPTAVSVEVAMRGVKKRFGNVVALDGVDLTVRSGEVHAIVGENGAGKSTLMHILAGVLAADAGAIYVHGERVAVDSVETANDLGIAMVHQHFMLFPSLTVAENLVIGHEPMRRGLFDEAAAIQSVEELGERYNLRVNPRARVSELTVGDLQRVEVLRALFRGAQILILDEPTGVLTPQETRGLFRLIRDLQAQGLTTIFISHKLDEVLEISDSITVLRDGQVTGVMETAQTSAHAIAEKMVGREVFLQFELEPVPRGEPVLEVEGLTGPGVKGISFQVRAGEIVGIAGVAGNGQSELADLIGGLMEVQGGRIWICGRDVTRASVAERRQAGLANIPEDRYRRGLAPQGTVSDNLILGFHDQPPIAERGLLRLGAILDWAKRLIQRFSIKTEGPKKTVETLSGGNAQRVVVARELAEEKALLLAAQPTRGIDISATEFVRNELLHRRKGSAGVLLISADLSEILSLSDRILVMFSGEIVGEVDGQEADETRLGLLMAGVREERAHA